MINGVRWPRLCASDNSDLSYDFCSINQSRLTMAATVRLHPRARRKGLVHARDKSVLGVSRIFFFLILYKFVCGVVVHWPLQLYLKDVSCLFTCVHSGDNQIKTQTYTLARTQRNPPSSSLDTQIAHRYPITVPPTQHRIFSATYISRSLHLNWQSSLLPSIREHFLARDDICILFYLHVRVFFHFIHPIFTQID